MSLPSYVINWDELDDLLGDLSDGLVARGISDVCGIQKVKGFAESIPAIQAQYKAVSWTLPYNIVLTAVTVNQSAWKGEDYWEFWVDGEKLFETVYTKELGEQKHWEVVQPVAKGSVIEIILHNNSGNSRNIWSDIEYLEVGDFEEVEPGDGEIIPTPDPEEPEEPEIPDPSEPEEPEEPDFKADVIVSFIDISTGMEVKPNNIYYDKSGLVNFTGDEVTGWNLVEPKTQTIKIENSDDYYVDFHYKKKKDIVEPEIPEEPEEPEFSAIVVIKYVDYYNNEEIKPRRVYYNRDGLLNFTGDEIKNWKLLEPKTQTIRITDDGLYEVIFKYKDLNPKSNVIIRYIDNLTGNKLKPNKVMYGQTGSFEVAGDIISGWNLLEPSVQQVNVVNKDDIYIDFYYDCGGLKVTVKHTNIETGNRIREDKIIETDRGLLTLTGEEIEGWILLEPKTQEFNITTCEDIIVEFKYKREPIDVEVPPGVPDVDHYYDWLVVMRWEGGVSTDLDLHAKYNGNEIFFGNKNDMNYGENDVILDGIWLDHDFTSHSGVNDRVDKPEIITILGNLTDMVTIHVHNWRGGELLTEEVTLEIFRFRENGELEMLKKISKKPELFHEENAKVYMVEINLETEEITLL